MDSILFSPHSQHFYTHLLIPKLSFRMEGEVLFINDTPVDLSGKRKVLHLFHLFIETNDHICIRDQLIREIYQPTAVPVSSRQLECFRQNLIKLVSRARTIASLAVSSHQGLALEWFAPRPRRKGWCLVQLKGYS